MRLEDCADWADSWALPEMFAGVPGKGAADAWHAALTDVEEHKLKGNAFCGAVADIMKFFDMIRRDLVYEMAKAAGMPVRILVAYRAYLENMQVYNCLAGGVGTPYWRKCGIPQGCPFSMCMVALIMRPWIAVVKTVAMATMSVYILADDVLMVAHGDAMTVNLAKAINKTHAYLHDLGARVAPDESYEFASTTAAKTWLADTWWEGIGAKIEVVKDFRYLGAHLTSGRTCTSSTLHKRWEKTYVQLKKLRYIPATTKAKLAAIRT